MQTGPRLRMAGVLGSVLITTSSALAQSPDILAFGGNGVLTWTNTNPNLFYQIQWAPSLSATSVWRSSYVTMQDIQSTNVSVSVGVPMFYRVQGCSNQVVYPALVAKTGQTASHAEGDDGDLEKGEAWPSPRFTDNSDGTVTDNLTGLIWLKDANAFGMRNWATALADCATLNSGEAGLTDGSAEGDWRLPNVRELQSLIDYGRHAPALSSGHPFTGTQPETYWTSSTYASSNTNHAWHVYLDHGHVNPDEKTYPSHVWPVRGKL